MSWRVLIPRDDSHAKAAATADGEKNGKDGGKEDKDAKDGVKDEKDSAAATGDDDASTTTASTAATSATTSATQSVEPATKSETVSTTAHPKEEPAPIPNKGDCAAGPDYLVSIEREMLGLTVENVLERTVVRTVLPGGAAGRAGAKVGSLIVRVGTVDTANLTHFETIDELRQSQRPLKLVLRRIGKDALRGAREEMGRLIRGGGFGGDAPPVLSGPAPPSPAAAKGGDENDVDAPALSGRPTVAETKELSRDFVRSLHSTWNEGTRRACRTSFTKRDDALSRAGERLVWVLTLLVIGLEREAVRLAARGDASLEEYDAEEVEKMEGGILGSPGSPKGRRGSGSSYGSAGSTSSAGSRHHHHRHADERMNARECVEAAKSVSKVLADHVKRHVGGPASAKWGQKKPPAGKMPPTGPGGQHVPMSKQLAMRKQQAGKPGAPQASGAAAKNAAAAAAAAGPLASQSPFESSLHAVGDVLHRTRTFLADPSSPPAALLRGEVISLLCDVLDVDAEMRLNDEEAQASSVAGGGQAATSAPINELGSAGSLLKLIVLNCSMMRSPGCTGSSSENTDNGSCSESKAYGSDESDEAKTASNDAKDYEDEHSAHAGNRFLAVVHRLAASKSTSARVTACSLGPVLWAHLDFPHQLQLRGVITRALHDVEVIVRKSTATVLHEIAELVFDSRAVPWLVLMCERAMTDPEPQLRSAAMTLTWHLAEHLPNAFCGDARKGSRSLRRLPPRTDPTFMDVYLLQCKLLPVATRLAEDRAPPVRLAVAAQCDRLCNALGEHWFSVIIDLLQALLGDADERVRSEATLCIPRLVDSVLSGMITKTVNVLESVLPVAIKLLKDPSVVVRVSLATASGELLTLLVGLQTTEELVAASTSSMSSISSADGGAPGASVSSSDSNAATGFQRYKKHIDEKLIPLVQRLLHDTDPEVTSAALRAVTNASRGNVREISSRRPATAASSSAAGDDEASVTSHMSMASVEKKEPVFIPVLSERQVLRLLPTLSDLATSAQWRVRQSAVEIVPALLGCTHRLETRSEIAQLCVKLMGDTVDAVRKTAAECLCLGGGSLGSHGEDDGSEWISAIVVPHLRACAKSENSKQRMLSLKMVEVIVVNGVCPGSSGPVKAAAARSVQTLPDDASGDAPSSPLGMVVEIGASLASDPVVNVRLNVGRVFGSIVNMLEEEELKYIVAILEEQIEGERQRDGGGDGDVLYFAARAASSARARLEDLTLDASMAQLDTSA